MIRPILLLTFMLASLATCLLASANDCPTCRFERTRSVSRPAVERSRSVIREGRTKVRKVASWVVRR